VIDCVKNDKLYCFAASAAKSAILKSLEENIVKTADMFAAANIDNISKPWKNQFQTCAERLIEQAT